MQLPFGKSRRLLAEGVELRRSGRLGEAAQRFRDVVRAEPRNAEAWRLLGSLHMQQGNLAEAEPALAHAATLATRSPEPHIELGVLLCRLGRTADGLASFQRAVKIAPDHAGAHNNLGIGLHDLGRFDEAIACFRRALKLDQRAAAAHYNLGNSLVATGQLDDAIASYRRAVAIRPDYATAWNNLGNTLRQAGRLDDAVAGYERAIAINPGYLEALRNLGKTEFARGRRETAIAPLRRALEINPEDATLHSDLAVIFQALDRFDEALAELDRALTIDPSLAQAHYNLGVVLRLLGRPDEARQEFARAIEHAPRRVIAYEALAEITKFTEGDPLLAAMEELAGDLTALPSEDQIRLHFALAKALADVKQHDRSFDHQLAGNAMKRRQITNDEATIQGQFDYARATLSRRLVRDTAGLGDPSRAPIFIIGMPRSGTTLIEQMLASHPKVFGAGELSDFREAAMAVATRVAPPQTYADMIGSLSGPKLAAIGADYVTRLTARAPGAERITDKMPGNYFYAGLIHLALPNARIIHSRRDPIDTCLSIFSKLFTEDIPYAYDLAELGRHYRAYAAIMDHWREVLPEEVMIEVQYESLVADFETEARRILAHCGLDWDDRCLTFYETERPVRTASAAQVRQPLYQSSIGRWRPDPKLLEPLIAALGSDLAEPAPAD